MRRSGWSLTLLVCVAAVISPAWASPPAPKVKAPASAPQAPYSEALGADARVRAAAARAKKANKLLLIDFGGNWCGDCRVLAGLLEEPAVKAFMARHYEIVLVDVGRMDKNLQISARYGLPKIRAVPAIVVVTPKGKILNPGDEFALSDAETMNPQVVMNKLAAWVP